LILGATNKKAMQTRQIKQKIASVNGIKKITRTMEMVAAAKMKRAVSRAIASQLYARYALELLANISREDILRHPLLSKGKGESILLVIFASDKGLCGAYNTNISRAVTAFKNENGQNTIIAITIGKHAERIAKRNGIEIKASFIGLEDPLIEGSMHPVQELIISEFMSGEYESVQTTYTQFIKPLEYKPKTIPFLPIDQSVFKELLEEMDKSNPGQQSAVMESKYLFEPDIESVFELVIPKLLLSILLQMMLEGRASEHSSRMVAMNGATDNATNLLDDLKLYYNKVRQEAITREISEIVGGSEALSNN